MSVKREQRRVERTPAEQARIEALRTKYERDKPGPDQLAASGEYEGPVQAGAYWEVRRVLAELKAERERQGLTLAQLAERSGIDKGAISKLETGRQVNPTVDTLSRIAAGLGLTLGMTLRGDDSPQRRLTETGRKKNVQPTAAREVGAPSADEAQRFVNYLLAFQARVAGQLAEAVKKPDQFLVEQARLWRSYFESGKRTRLSKLAVPRGVYASHPGSEHIEPLLTFDMDGWLAFRCCDPEPADSAYVQKLVEKLYR